MHINMCVYVSVYIYVAWQINKRKQKIISKIEIVFLY